MSRRHVAISPCKYRGRHVLLHREPCGSIERSLGEAHRRSATGLRAAQKLYPFETIAICILPDHVHAIWTLPSDDSNFPLRWRLIKSNFSRAVPAESARTESKIRKREKGIWQRRYWEHAIRDDADLARHVDYIHFHPVKHGYASRAAGWPHSSFSRYVAQGTLPADWGGDMREIAGKFGE